MAFSTGCMLFFARLNKVGSTLSPDRAADVREERGYTCPTPWAVHPGEPQIGGSEGRALYAPQGPGLGVVLHPRKFPHLGTSRRVGKSCCSRWGRRLAASGEGGSPWGGGALERRLRPPPPPEEKGRPWPARTQPDAATSAAGADGRGPGGIQRVGAGTPPTRSRVLPLLTRLPPPRAGLSIHKFSRSAATRRRSQPGPPRIRPPAAHGPRVPALR